MFVISPPSYNYIQTPLNIVKKKNYHKNKQPFKMNSNINFDRKVTCLWPT